MAMRKICELELHKKFRSIFCPFIPKLDVGMSQHSRSNTLLMTYENSYLTPRTNGQLWDSARSHVDF